MKVRLTNPSLLHIPPIRGKRIIILNGLASGWISGALLLLQHGDMTDKLFKKWFRKNCLPNLTPNNVIVLNNANYHSVNHSFFTSKKNFR